MNALHGVTAEDFKDIISDTSTTASGAPATIARKPSSSSSSVRFRSDPADDSRDTISAQGFNSMQEYKSVVSAVATSTAPFYKPIFKLDAIQSTLECFKANKQAMFSTNTHASLAKSMAARIRTETSFVPTFSGTTYTNGNAEEVTEAEDTPTKKSRLGK